MRFDIPEVFAGRLAGRDGSSKKHGIEEDAFLLPFPLERFHEKRKSPKRAVMQLAGKFDLYRQNLLQYFHCL